MAADTTTSKPDEVARFVAANVRQLEGGMAKITHCLEQLDDQQIWWRPSESMNSIANLLLHLSGNMRQWLICGLSEIPDQRMRQTEFDDRSLRSKAELRSALESALNESIEQISVQTSSTLMPVRLVQEFEIDGFTVIVDSVGHFCGHVQEIVHLTRCQLLDRYRFEFVPQEQQSESCDAE
ncbi:MAG: DUF1572 family protein [Planctomycetota bacterium]